MARCGSWLLANVELEFLELEVIDLGRFVQRLEWAWKKVVGIT
jgi:hypothetical protein